MMPGERARAPQNCPAITKDDTKPIPTVTRWLHFFAPEVQSSKLGRPALSRLIQFPPITGSAAPPCLLLSACKIEKVSNYFANCG
jgi:hypothetical protein